MGLLTRQFAPVIRDLVLNVLVASPLYPRMFRPRLLSALGHHVAKNANIAPRSFYGARTGLSIGDGSYINYECFFDLSAPITIGKGVAVGFRTTFVTSGHQIGAASRRAGALTNAPIVLGDGCWVGANVVIQPGVTIAPGAVVAAGSVVTKDITTADVYGGVPAALLRRLPGLT